VDSANVVLQGGEASHTTANSTTEECKFVNRSPESHTILVTSLISV
jgi:hypothetical protein